MSREYLPFDQLAEERREQRFDERSEARGREASEQFRSGTQRARAEHRDVDEFFVNLERERRRPHVQELIESWTRGLDMLETAMDLLLERFYEPCIVTSCAAVEAMLAGLLRYHIRATHFARNRKLGDEIVAQLLRNSIKDKVPKLFREAFGLNLSTRTEWAAWTKVHEARNDVVHRAKELSLREALGALWRSTQVVGLLDEVTSGRKETDLRLPTVWHLLHGEAERTLAVLLEHGLPAIADQLELEHRVGGDV